MPTTKEADFIRVWLRHGETIQDKGIHSLLPADRLPVAMIVGGVHDLCTPTAVGDLRFALTPRGEDLVASAQAAGFDIDACPHCLGAQVLANFDGGGLHPAPGWTGPVRPRGNFAGFVTSDAPDPDYEGLPVVDDTKYTVVQIGEAVRCACYVEPCKTCQGSKRVVVIGDFTNPCPDCKDTMESISGDIEGVQVILIDDAEKTDAKRVVPT